MPREQPGTAGSPRAAPDPPTERRSLGALRHRNFSLLWSSLIISNTGTWMQAVGQGWLVLELTDRPLYLGLVALAFALPMTFLPPVGGAIADRVDRLKLLRATQALSMLEGLLLAALTLTGVVRAWHIIVLAFFGAILLAIDNPTRQALLPSLVGREDLMSAILLNSAVFTGAALFGPALGGFLLGYIGAGGLFLINAVSYGAVLVATLLMRGVPARTLESATGLWADVTEGLRFVANTRLLLLLVAVSGVSGLLGRSYSVLLPVFARDIWEVGERGYGILLGAPGAGALLGAFGLALFGEVGHKGRLLILSVIGFALVLLAFSYSALYWPAAGLLLVAGVLNSIFGATIATLIQTNTPGRLRGRAMSLYTVTIIGIPSLGSMGIATVAEWLGTRNAVGLGAGILLLMSLWLLLSSKRLREAG